MYELHHYHRLLFPSRREAWFVGRHRRRGHKLVHVGPVKGQCHWHCDCQARYWC